ncbi:MAG: hypothetical protein NC177_15210 [Ruminococcus flavefaciens]|nr:hypothetical protein [Ruminococcus flavefaciens]
MGNLIIDCDTYRSIKKMDCGEMQGFIMHYAENSTKGSSAIDLHKLRQDIKTIRVSGRNVLKK